MGCSTKPGMRFEQSVHRMHSLASVQQLSDSFLVSPLVCRSVAVHDCSSILSVTSRTFSYNLFTSRLMWLRRSTLSLAMIPLPLHVPNAFGYSSPHLSFPIPHMHISTEPSHV